MQSNLTRWISRLALITTLAVLTTGCLSYRGGQLTKLEPGAKAAKPVVEKLRLDLRVTRNGEPLSSGAMTEKVTALTLQNLTNSGLFSDIQMIAPGTACWSNECVLTYKVDNWGNEGAAMASGFICGLTFGVIPGFATDHFTIQAEVLDYQGKSHWKETYDDQMTTVIWLGFLPCVFAPSCYPMTIADKTLNNIYQHSIRDMIAAKAFAVPVTATASVPSTPPVTSQSNPSQP